MAVLLADCVIYISTDHRFTKPAKFRDSSFSQIALGSFYIRLLSGQAERLTDRKVQHVNYTIRVSLFSSIKHQNNSPTASFARRFFSTAECSSVVVYG